MAQLFELEESLAAGGGVAAARNPRSRRWFRVYPKAPM